MQLESWDQAGGEAMTGEFERKCSLVTGHGTRGMNGVRFARVVKNDTSLRIVRMEVADAFSSDGDCR